MYKIKIINTKGEEFIFPKKIKLIADEGSIIYFKRPNNQNIWNRKPVYIDDFGDIETAYEEAEEYLRFINADIISGKTIINISDYTNKVYEIIYGGVNRKKVGD